MAQWFRSMEAATLTSRPEFALEGARVLVTGHTGFKGAWLSLWLLELGADVVGYALPPTSPRSLYTLARLERDLRSIEGDVRDLEHVRRVTRESRPDVVFHAAAQPLVLESYADPVGTYATNVLGTAHVLDAIRAAGSVRAAIVVTTDKCYENREWPWPYREVDRLGGRDPYSSSKACAELVTAAYCHSFFASPDSPSVATVRAGNVIGGGDWAPHRLVADLMRETACRRPLVLRHPLARRPWQHVLDPLYGYLLLAHRLRAEGSRWSGGWNFGPGDSSDVTVRELVERFRVHMPELVVQTAQSEEVPHEASRLRLDSSKARGELGWRASVPLDDAVRLTVEWYREADGDPARAREIAMTQIRAYVQRLGEAP